VTEGEALALLTAVCQKHNYCLSVEYVVWNCDVYVNVAADPYRTAKNCDDWPGDTNVTTGYYGVDLVRGLTYVREQIEKANPA